MERNRKLEIGKTIIYEKDVTVGGKLTHVTVYYGNSVQPEQDGSRKRIKKAEYRRRLKEFLDSEAGQEYIIPDDKQIDDDESECYRIDKEYYNQYQQRQKHQQPEEKPQTEEVELVEMPEPEKPAKKEKKVKEKKEKKELSDEVKEIRRHSRRVIGLEILLIIGIAINLYLLYLKFFG